MVVHQFLAEEVAAHKEEDVGQEVGGHGQAREEGLVDLVDEGEVVVGGEVHQVEHFPDQEPRNSHYFEDAEGSNL